METSQQQIEYLPCRALLTDPNVPRRAIDHEKDRELISSIREHGILMPLLIRRNDGNVYVIAGQRRLRAAAELELYEVPCITAVTDPVIVSIIENVQRQDLAAVEEAEIFEKVLSTRGCTQTALGKMVGRKQSTIAEIIAIAKLPEVIKSSARTNRNVARSILVELAKLDDAEKQTRLFEEYLKGDACRHSIREHTRHRSSADVVCLRQLKDLSGRLDRLAVDAMGELKAEIYTTMLEISGKLEKKLRQLALENYRHADNLGDHDIHSP